MQTSTKTKLAVAVAAAVGMLGMNAAMAHKGGKANAGYVGDSNGHLVLDSAGKCVQNSAWTPALALEECGDKAPAVKKISLKADAHFDFDKSDLKAGDKKGLDDATAKMKGMKVESISVVGHTCNIGTDAYNQKLSERRAAAVKNYMVGKGVNASLIQASGKGESQPVADNKTEAGRVKNRRVDIEIRAAQDKK